jgi:hypothetical protein
LSGPSCTLLFFQVADPAYILSPCCSEFPAPVVGMFDSTILT